MPVAMIGTGDGEGGGGSGGADDLADVRLVSFTATPTAIGPFGTSMLRWHVEGVIPRVRIHLNNSVVGAIGNASVSPAVSATYTLSATSGAARKTLGHVTVSVERSTCVESSLGNLLPLLHQQVFMGIQNSTDPKYKTFWTDPVHPDLSVTFSEPRIKIHMRFRVNIPEWYVPNPTVTLDLEFGLGAANGLVISVVPTADASVSAGLIGWFLGPYLMIALAMAGDKAKKGGLDSIEALIGYINTVLVHPDPGKKLRSVIAETRGGQPFFGFIQCSTGTDGLRYEIPDLSNLATLEVTG